MRYQIYPSDLTNEQWQFIQPLLPFSRAGKPRQDSLRGVVNAIFYLHHTGCPWRYLPRSYPHWSRCYYYFSRWSRAGNWERICHALHALAREKIGRSSLPHLAIIDSQSVRAARGEERAFDGFKKVMGRKRNILVDALGIIFACKVHAADQQEQITGKKILDNLPKAYEENLEKIIADRAYQRAFLEHAEVYHQIPVEISDQKLTGTKMKPFRWVVERTFAWLNHYRRMSRDYERKVRNSESMLYLSMLPILLRRITATIS